MAASEAHLISSLCYLMLLTFFFDPLSYLKRKTSSFFKFEMLEFLHAYQFICHNYVVFSYFLFLISSLLTYPQCWSSFFKLCCAQQQIGFFDWHKYSWDSEWNQLLCCFYVLLYFAKFKSNRTSLNCLSLLFYYFEWYYLNQLFCW